MKSISVGGLKRASCREIVREKLMVITFPTSDGTWCAEWGQSVEILQIERGTIAEAEIACIQAIYEKGKEND